MRSRCGCAASTYSNQQARSPHLELSATFLQFPSALESFFFLVPLLRGAYNMKLYPFHTYIHFDNQG